MEFVQVQISITDRSLSDMIIALLSDQGYDGFEEADDGLTAYIKQDVYSEDALKTTLSPYGLEYSAQQIAEQNWNKVWEENFQPVAVEGFCTVRAAFHKLSINTPYEIIITPKMSFGTGHHATTQLMMMQMKEIDFVHRTVLDFGTGTGILAILGEKLGAADVLAVDNDEWSYVNAQENIENNGCKKVHASLGDLQLAKGKTFDIILANINRNILLENMDLMKAILKNGGYILMSGILKEDVNIISQSAREIGFELLGQSDLNNWVVLVFKN